MNIETATTEPDVGLLESEDSTVTASQNQVTFEDTSPITVEKNINDLAKLHNNFNPFPEKPPLDLLTRAVKIETVIWTSSTTFLIFEPLITAVGVSALLKTVLGDLNQVYGMYRYLRCGFKITIKLNSTPYHQGTMIASWVPSLFNDSSASLHEVACGNHAMILSASKQDQVEFHIPYTHPDPFWDLIKYSTLVDPGPKFILTVLNALLTSNGAVADQVPITIWIQLEDVAVAGLLPTGYNSALTATTTHTQTVGVNSVSASKNFSETTFKSQSGKALTKITSKESEAKDKNGLNFSGLLDIVQPIVKNIPFLGTAVKIGQTIVNSLDKPISTQTPTVTVTRNNPSMTILQGDFCGESLGMMPVTRVSKNIGLISSDMTVSKFAQIPNWFLTKSVSTAGVVFTQRVHPHLQ